MRQDLPQMRSKHWRTEMGKGDKPRPMNRKRYDENWDYYIRNNKKRGKNVKADKASG